MPDADRLYSLTPAIYRERDAAQGYPLRALLRIISEQVEIVEADIERLWDNFFIETCDRWAVSYIGDLVANNLLHDGSRHRDPDTARELFTDLTGPDLRPPLAVRTRADVAKTIYYRRRKGTLPMLEELARDVTGWGAHAVEFFETLVWSQNLNHLRLHSTGCPDLRSVEMADRVNGPFDAYSHTVDVRHPQQFEGWHNIRNIGFFLWRLRSYPLERVPARQAAAPWQYHFSVLGNPAPLFSRWRREGDEAGLATEVHVPGPIRPAAFFEDVRGYQATPPALRPDHTEFYGFFAPAPPFQSHPEASFAIFVDGAPVPPAQIRCMDLDTFKQPSGNIVGVDLRHGRMAFGPTITPVTGVDVFYHYGFSADLGGGPYSRRAWMLNPALAALRLTVRQGAAAPEFASLDAALAEWVTQGRPNTIITIADSRNYAVTLPVDLTNGWLVIQAADGERPLLQPAGGVLEAAGTGPQPELTLSGLLVEGTVHVTGDLQRLRLLHTTLVPGGALTHTGAPATTNPSLLIDAGPTAAPINTKLKVEIAFSILGPIRMPAHASRLTILDSIVDGLGTTAIAAPDSWLERVTVFGASEFRQLTLASESIFTGRVRTARKQAGCVRFSFVPRLSRTPRRYRCQPDLEIAAALAQAEKEKGAPLTAAEKNIDTQFCFWLARPQLHLHALRRPRLRAASLRRSPPD